MDVCDPVGHCMQARQFHAQETMVALDNVVDQWNRFQLRRVLRRRFPSRFFYLKRPDHDIQIHSLAFTSLLQC